MKFLFLPLLVLQSFGSIKVNAQTDSITTTDSLITKLKNLELDNYLKKPTGSFLFILPPSYEQKLLAAANTHYSHMLVLSYPQKPYLEIQLFYYYLQYTNPNGISRKQQAKDLRKEIVHSIKIYQASLCINGCD